MLDEQEAIKKEIAKMVQRLAELRNAKRLESEISDVNTNEPIYIVGWVLMSEYESPSLMKEAASGNLNVYPEGQPRSISRGLYEFGVDAYRV